MMNRTMPALLLLLLGPAVCSAESKDKYTLIRENWANSEDFNPLFGVGDGRDEILELFVEKEFEKFLAESEKYLQKVPIDIVLYSLRATACGAIDDMQGYFRNNAAAWGLAGSIASSGTGKTEETAFRVVSTKEEYGLLHLMGLEARAQRLVYGRDGTYDVLTVEMGGEEREIWFEVSKQFEFYKKTFQK